MESGASVEFSFENAYVEAVDRQCPTCESSLFVVAYGDDMYTVRLSCRDCSFKSDTLTRLFGLGDSDNGNVFEVLRAVSADADIQSP